LVAEIKDERPFKVMALRKPKNVVKLGSKEINAIKVVEDKEYYFDIKRAEEILDQLMHERKIKLLRNHTIFIANKVKGSNTASSITLRNMKIIVIYSLEIKYRRLWNLDISIFHIRR
jgi:hypothetical protein